MSGGRTVAIMQPYLFPYAGYISLIKHTDQFILFDPVQFIRHGWIDRNRVLKQGDGWIYVRVPLQPYGSDATIDAVRIERLVSGLQRQLETPNRCRSARRLRGRALRAAGGRPGGARPGLSHRARDKPPRAP